MAYCNGCGIRLEANERKCPVCGQANSMFSAAQGNQIRLRDDDHDCYDDEFTLEETHKADPKRYTTGVPSEMADNKVVAFFNDLSKGAQDNMMKRDTEEARKYKKFVKLAGTAIVFLWILFAVFGAFFD